MSSLAKRFSSKRMLMIVLVTAVMLLALLFIRPSRTCACPAFAIYYSYFSDNTYTEVVGTGRSDCAGHLHVIGTQTSFIQVDDQVECPPCSS